eukprot:6330636-Prymnesium_polylepis.1
MPGCLNARLPDCPIARLRDSRLPDCVIARLRDCPIARLPDCAIAGPPLDKRVALSIDDVNMAPLETFGAAPAIELLRQVA